MGSTLTNTQPKDTYKSILKTSDTTELSATAKYVSDGNGNDSPLALSTSAVGIGTTSPAQNLSVEENTLNPSLVSLTGSFGTSRGVVISLDADELGANEAALKFTTSVGAPYGGYVFSTQGGEKMRILSSGGLTFNGDTSSNNALSDYEQGTWTMGISFGGASVGATYILNTGRYTKIGRQVTASGYLAMSAKGSSTGDATITGLPFTSGNTYQAITSASLRLDSVSFANAFQAYVDGPSTVISLGEVTEAGVASNLTNADFTDSSAVMVSVTYTV